MAEIDRVYQASNGLKPATLALLGPAWPAADAYWRKRVTEWKDQIPWLRAGVVTNSLLQRGIITALEWLRPPSAAHRFGVFGTIEPACLWLQAECGRPLEALPRLYAEAGYRLGHRDSSIPSESCARIRAAGRKVA